MSRATSIVRPVAAIKGYYNQVSEQRVKDSPLRTDGHLAAAVRKKPANERTNKLSASGSDLRFFIRFFVHCEDENGEVLVNIPQSQ